MPEQRDLGGEAPSRRARPMAPRKRASSSKKPSQQQASQPSKFGIQHFFERYSQSVAPAGASSQDAASQTPPAEHCLSGPAAGHDDVGPPEVSPPVSKAPPLKRFKFSPGMLIEQSQDDGGNEITWKISPVNERLRSVAKRMPEAVKVLSDASNRVSSSLRLCSQLKHSSLPVGHANKPHTSPSTETIEGLFTFPSRVHNLEADVGNKISVCRDTNGSSNRIVASQQSTFLTPPSIAYRTGEFGNDSRFSGAAEQSGSQQHKKALLELLDQVEDVLTVEEPNPLKALNNSVPKLDVEDKILEQVSHDSSGNSHCSLSTITFLVLEVSESRRVSDSSNSQNPSKVLRLLNEHNGEERLLLLCDDWLHSLVAPGDTVRVIGKFDHQGKCVVDSTHNFVIINPDILISGTRVSSSFTCLRRAVLDERIRCNERSSTAVIGILLHQLFQAALLEDFPTTEFLEKHSRIILKKNIESLYESGASEEEAYNAMTEAIPKLRKWLMHYIKSLDSNTSFIDFGTNFGQKNLRVTEVIDIEEIVWAPRYGLKGMIDASVRVKMNSSDEEASEKIMPLEFKTGKAISGRTAMEHSAQVILYALLMSERYFQDMDSGLLFYLQSDETQGIMVRRPDLVGLIMRRNELASEVLRASKMQLLPSMLQNQNVCKRCRHLNVCAIYHKAEGGNMEASGLGDLFDSSVGHLAPSHCDFLVKWERLIDLEAKETLIAKKKIWQPSIFKGEKNAIEVSDMIIDLSSDFFPNNNFQDGRFVYRFVHQLSHETHSQAQTEKSSAVNKLSECNLDCSLKAGDYVVLSTESGRIAVANGMVIEIGKTHVLVSFSRRLRLPGTKLSLEIEELKREVWRISKDEISSSYAIMRFNILQLLLNVPQRSHLRKLIINLEAPRFDSGGILSQDPAVSYIRSEKSLNDDQRRTVLKILAAKDYTLILGMPGTGKTSTLVHAVKALLIKGYSILLTSYTNSAIDNLLVKLKAQGIDFVRIGRYEAVHKEIQDHCFSAMKTTCTLEDLKHRMNQVRVVGSTCLGMNHPLLANKKFDVCIMDEAGQTTIPVSLGPLMFASMFVLVGDHYQLPPLVQSTEARESGMGQSLFCKLSEAHPEAISALQCQYRMCAGIMELSNTLIYGNRLRCGSSEVANGKLGISIVEPIATWLKHVLDPERSTIFVDTDMLPAIEVKEHKSVNNPTEAEIIAEVVEALVNGGVTSDAIGIITPYNSQASRIHQVVGSFIEIHTIDKYQGRDKECIIVSFVRSSEIQRLGSSTILGDWQRINVAITRAKKKLIMVGSCRTLSKAPLLKLLIDKVDKQAGIIRISKKEFFPNGRLRRCSQPR